MIVPFVLLVGWHERLSWLALVAVVMAGVGAFLLSTGGRFEFQKGDALELVGALFWSLHLVIFGKVAVRFSSIQFAVGQFLVAGLLNFLAGLFLEQLVFNGSLIGAVVYTAFFSVGMGYALQVWAQRYTPPSDAAIILSLEAVFAVLSGWLFLAETLSLTQIIGCSFILGGVLLTQFPERNSE